MLHGRGSLGQPVAALRHVPTGISLELAPLHAASSSFRYAPAGGLRRLARRVDAALRVADDAWLCPAAHALLQAHAGSLPVPPAPPPRRSRRPPLCRGRGCAAAAYWRHGTGEPRIKSAAAAAARCRCAT